MRGVKWRIYVPAEVITEYAGVKLREYYTNPEIMLRSQLKVRDIFNKIYGLPDAVTVSPDYGSYVEASMLGLKIIFPEDGVPWPEGPILKSIKDVNKLKILNPYKEGLMSRAIQTYYYMKEKVGKRINIELGGTEGPITTAVLLRGQEFFVDLYLYPKKVHKLLEIVTEVSLMLREVIEKVTGEPIRSTGIADDYSGMLSPDQYIEFAFPYQKEIYNVFGKEERIFHCELLRKEHLKFLSQLGVTFYDPGGDQYLTIKDIKEEIDIPFSWNIKAFHTLLYGTPESIKREYRQAVADGAPWIVTELVRKIPPENIRAFIEVAKEYE